MQSLGQKLKKYRELRQLTQRQVAERLGLNPSTVQSWEVGRHTPKLTLSQTKVLCDLFQISLNELFDEFSQLNETPNVITLGQQLKARRESLKLTRLQVAQACDVVESTIINWESDRHRPKLYPSQMKALCDLLNLTLEELVDWEKNR